jgi:hypothetical protein
MSRRKAWDVVISVLGMAFLALSAGEAQEPANLEELLSHVGDRIAHFYTRALNIVCTERSTVQPIDSSNSPDGFARTVESEVRMEADAAAPGMVSIVRKVRAVNGRVPRDEDHTDRAGCTDPGLRSPEPLTFLLPANRPQYEFKGPEPARDRNRNVLMIEFASRDRRSRPELVEDASGHEDCFDWTGPIASRGRIWVDAESFDVVRIERHLPGPVDVSVPFPIQRRYRLANWVTIVREDVSMRYKTVAFTDPPELLLVPESIDTYSVLRGGLQSTRRNQTFSDYKRFVTAGRVVER